MQNGFLLKKLIKYTLHKMDINNNTDLKKTVTETVLVNTFG